ncbi:hypothetical protein [Aeromicrobium sp. P5_D10]
MSVLVAGVALIALVVLVVHLWRLVASDGYGFTSPPRSHREELGTWVDRELQR